MFGFSFVTFTVRRTAKRFAWRADFLATKNARRHEKIFVPFRATNGQSSAWRAGFLATKSTKRHEEIFLCPLVFFVAISRAGIGCGYAALGDHWRRIRRKAAIGAAPLQPRVQRRERERIVAEPWVGPRTVNRPSQTRFVERTTPRPKPATADFGLGELRADGSRTPRLRPFFVCEPRSTQRSRCSCCSAPAVIGPPRWAVGAFA